MRDIELAKQKLVTEDLSLVIVSEQQILFTSKERGIKPLYQAVQLLADKLKRASLADRVIGRAAAVLSSYAGIEEIYTYLISEEAISVLNKAEISYSYQEATPNIINRDGTDICPVEKLSQGIEDGSILMDKIEIFLQSIEKK